MLNYVWLALLVLGIGTALTTDLLDQSRNKYRNSEPLGAVVEFSVNRDSLYNQRSHAVILKISSSDFSKFYNDSTDNDVDIPAAITFNKNEKEFILFLKTDDSSPGLWKEMAAVSGKKDDLSGTLRMKSPLSGSSARAEIVFSDISFIRIKEVTNAALDYAKTAVEIALGLIGIMALWLGVMKVAEEAGLIARIANFLKPVTRRLFPDIPADHPAMGAMIMNISANMLGLGNSATPFGLKAMEELDKLNPEKGTATNSMITFLVINTSGLTLIPATAIAIRASLGSYDPAIIIGTSIFGALCATVTGLLAVKIMEKFPLHWNNFRNQIYNNRKKIFIALAVIVLIIISFTAGIVQAAASALSFLTPEVFKSVIEVISIVAIPLLIFIFIGYGALKKIKVYDSFVEGAKEGFNIAVRIIPYLVAMLMAIGIFRAGGAMNWLLIVLQPVTNLLGIPAEAMPMALMRPLSGSGSLGIMSEIMAQHGPDSFLGIMVSTYFGSTETTFYILAVYFSSVSIRKTRHALPAGLLADIAGILGATFIVRLLFS